MGFLFMFLFWIILSIACMYYAKGKGRKDAWAFFFLSILLSPLIGFIIALIVKPNYKNIEEDSIMSGESKKCPFCAELIKTEATVCRYCGKNLPNQIHIR